MENHEINMAKVRSSVVYDRWSHGWSAFDKSVLIHKHMITPQKMEPCNGKYLNVITFGGHWSREIDLDLAQYTLPLVITQLVLYYTFFKFISFFCKPLRTPSIVPQILAGILLGPSLNWFLSLEKYGFSTLTVADPLRNLIWLELMFHHFLMGVKMDPTMIFTTGKKATVIGLLIFIVPGTFTVYLVSFMRTQMGYPYSIHRLLVFFGASQAMTCFPDVAYLLNELQILNSEIGRLALSSAMISDIGFRIMLIYYSNVSSDRDFLNAFIYSNDLILVIKYVCIPIFGWIIRRTPKGRLVRDKYVFFVILLVIMCGFASAYIGQHILFWPFVLGLAVPAGPPLGLALANKLETFFTGLLLPIFVITTGAQLDLMKIQSKHLEVFAIVIFFTFLVKLISVLVPAICCNIPYKDSFALSLILGYKGIAEIAMLVTLKDIKILDDESFTTAVLAIGLVSGVINPLVRVLYDPMRKYSGYIKRTVYDTKRHTELRIIACVHEEENVPTIIKFLQASNPTRADPICVYLIHLIELLGRSAPVLISHQLWEESSTENNPSHYIINAFRHYEKKYAGMLTVYPFTAMSPIPSMHDDICMFALSKRAPLIIIPFHGRLNIDGTMNTTNFSIRTVNNHVLNSAPCSVGLLVDRGHLGRSAVLLNRLTYRVGVLFLGGNDDREALAIAGRMAENPDVEVEVLRLVAPNNTGVNEWQMKQDDEAIMKFQIILSNTTEDIYTLSDDGETHKRVAYTELLVKDGEELAKLINNIAYDYDLVLVGRRLGVYSPLTEGLSDWGECPELGVLGDMLAMPDMKSAYSVLVVQQQIMGGELIT